MSCLTQSSVFAPSVSRGLSPQQVYTAVTTYTITGSGKTPGTVRQAKLLGCGVKALTRLYDSRRRMKHVLAACNVKASGFVAKSSVMAALCDPLGLDRNLMPFLL
ncbi:unnamed protein product [Cladocopium goreaui]|uniref:Uncharacterized protein n=1 Tax=Cladocopium goreaui TaxID=2562237 RepID=A0A9P1GIH0_9DINO|nr:unnamed protein product [Cladocopium goreaui]